MTSPRADYLQPIGAYLDVMSRGIVTSQGGLREGPGKWPNDAKTGAGCMMAARRPFEGSCILVIGTMSMRLAGERLTHPDRCTKVKGLVSIANDPRSLTCV